MWSPACDPTPATEAPITREAWTALYGEAYDESAYLHVLSLESRLSRDDWADLHDPLGYAEHFVAMREAGRSEILATVRRLTAALARFDDLDPGTRSLLLSLLGQQWIEIGVTDRAGPPIKEAVELTDTQLAQSGGTNYGALLNAHVRAARLRMAVADYAGAVAKIEAFKANSYLPLLEFLKGLEHAPHRYPEAVGMVEALLGGALTELAREDASVIPEAVAAFERVPPAAQPLDRFSTAGKLATLELLSGNAGAARIQLESLRAAVEEGRYAELPPEESAWLAALEAQVAEILGEGRQAARKRLEQAFHVMLERWREVERRGGVGFLRYGRARLVIEQLVALSSPRDGLALVAEAQRMGVLWHALGEPRVELDLLLDVLLDSSSGLLMFVPGKTRSWIFAVDEDGIVRHPAPGFSSLLASANAFMAALRRAPTDLPTPSARARRRVQIQEHGTELVRALFPEAVRERVRSWSHVQLVGAESLGLALEALTVFEDRALGQCRALSYLPSLTVGAALASRRNPEAALRHEHLLLVAAPVLHAEFGHLPAITLNPSDLEPLTRHFLSSSVLSQKRATVAALSQEQMRAHGVLQVLTHGAQAWNEEFRPQVLLSPDGKHERGRLTYDRVLDLSVPELVVLTTCHSGAGTARVGDSGASDLGGAFLLAGASCVLLSNDELRLRPSLILSAAFYGQLSSGFGVAEALRRARVELAQHPEFGDLYYGSLIRAYGSSDRRLPLRAADPSAREVEGSTTDR